MIKEPSERRSILGKKGEKLAEKFLKKRSYRILERRYRCRYGEVDLIARQGGVVCFIEVKTRSDASFGQPEEALSRAKISRLVRTAQHFLKKRKLEGYGVRFDVVTVNCEKAEPRINLIQGAFDSPVGE